MVDFIPTQPHLVRIWECLSPGVRIARLREAGARQKILERVKGRGGGISERAAVAKFGGGMDRASYRRYRKRWEQFGLDGLVDWRQPPPSVLTDVIRGVICTLRRNAPQIEVVTILEHLAKHHQVKSNDTSVKRVLREAGLARRRGPPPSNEVSAMEEETRLELGGMKLVEAAIVETGYVHDLAVGVLEQVAQHAVPSEPRKPDTQGRDEWGRFEPEYNERFRSRGEDDVGPGFTSVEVKRAGMDPTRLHVARADVETVERKLTALLCSPLVGSGRWDGMRVSRGELLGELCGYPYMPATLDLFTRELKYLGVANTLWEIHARRWLEQTRGWGDAGSGVVLYLDGTTKSVWTKFFSQATPVSRVNRVMPGLEQVCFHSGYGVPLWMVTHSGRAVLVKVLPEYLERLETFLDADVGRVVVIDAEGNSLPFLKGLELVERGWVTRLRPSLIEGKVIFDRTGYSRYRDGDRVRMGRCHLADPDQPKTELFPMRVIELKRRRTGQVTYLGASQLLAEDEWPAAKVADLYFERWPKQEANFRAVNRAVDLKEVHGYGKQRVDNVTVITRLDKLRNTVRRLEERRAEQTQKREAAREKLQTIDKVLRRTEQRQETVQRQLRPLLKKDQRVTAKTRRLLREQEDLALKHGHKEKARAQAEAQHRKAEDREEQTQKQLQRNREEQHELADRRQIFQHDVELDSLFSVLKVGLVLLVNWVQRQYLGNAKMEAVTFLERVATLPARLRISPQMELITFEYNRRDPEVMALLQANCAALNSRHLKARSGRTLRFAIDPAPAPRLPPPARVNSEDRMRWR